MDEVLYPNQCTDEFGNVYKNPFYRAVARYNRMVEEENKNKKEVIDIYSKEYIKKYMNRHCPSVSVDKFYDYYSKKNWITNAGTKLDTWDKIKDVADAWERRNSR